MANDGSVVIDILANDKEFRNGLSSLTQKAKAGTAAIGAAMAAASAALVAFGAGALKVGSNFEAAMSEVAAISGASGKELDALTQKAKDMGASTKFSATEAAEGLKYMAMAGWDTQDMLNGLSGIMDLAAASGEDLGNVSDIVTDALTAFGLQASDSAHFADVLAMASSKSNTKVGLMGATFRYVAPIAGAMKYSIEDTAVAIGLMANAGIKGEQAGTSLRAMLTRLVKPPKDAASAMDALGISVTNADGTMRPLNDVLVELRTKFADLDDSQKAAMASSIAGTEAMSGMLAIVNASDADFKKLTKAINGADGAAAKMAETMQGNLKGKATILGSTLEGLKIRIYEGLEQSLKTAVDQGIKSVNKLSKSLKNGALKGAVDKIGQSIEKLSRKIADAADKWIPKLAEGFAWLVDNGEALVTVAGAAVAAIATFKIVNQVSGWFSAAALQVQLFTMANGAAAIAQAALNGALTLGQIAVGVLTGEITLATAAQALWNAVVSANPLGLLAIAAAAVVAGLTALIIHMNNTESEAEAFARSVKESAEATDAWIESCKDVVAAGEETRENIKKEANDALALANEYEKLAGSARETAAQKERLAEVVNQLNELFPDLVINYDKETDTLEGNTEAIYDSIKARIELKKQQALLDSWISESVALLKKEAEGKHELKEANEKLKEANQRLTDAQIRSQEANRGISFSNAVTELQSYQNSVKAAQENVDGLTARQADMAERMVFVDEQIGITSATMATQAGAAGEAAAGIRSIAEAYDTLAPSQQAAIDGILSAYEAMTASLSSLSSEIKLDSETTWKTVQKNQEDTIEKTREFADLYAQLINAGVSESYLNAIGATGPESIPLLEGMLDAGIDEVLASQSEWEDAYSKIGDAFTESLSLGPDMEAAIQAYISGETGIAGSLKSAIENADFANLAKSIPEGAGEGIENNKSIATDAASAMGEDMGTAFQTSVEAHSPSKLFERISESIPEGVALGIKNRETDVTCAVEGSAQAAHAAAENEVVRLNFASVGLSIADGIAQGIRNGDSAIINAARESVQAAVRAAKDEAEIHSPSGLFSREIGSPMAEGVAAGYVKKTADIVREMENAVAYEQARIAGNVNRANGAAAMRPSVSAPITVYAEINAGPINNELDIDWVGREIGQRAAREIRQRGGVCFAQR